MPGGGCPSGEWGPIRLGLICLLSAAILACGGGGSSAPAPVPPGPAAPAGLRYGQNPAIYTVGQSIQPNVPGSSGGAVASYQVTPTLPAGLAWDAATGVMSGTPQAPAALANHTVTATNTGGSTQATLTFTVNDAAPAIAYGSGAYTFTKGTSIAIPAPQSSGGAVVTWSLSPTLPAGLAFNTTDGSFSGSPTALLAATAYTVTATNTGGSTQATLTLTVNDAAPAIAYGSGAYTFTMGVPIGTLLPQNSGGAVVIWTLSPALPSGLSFSTVDGSISGTPGALAAGSGYAITATNSGGSSQVVPQITVNPPPPMVVTQPLEVTVDMGGPVSFTVTASGTGPLDYQWQKDGTDIPGATAPTLLLASAALADTGASYRVLVRDGYGGVVISSSALLTVRPDLATWLGSHPQVAAAIRWQVQAANPVNSYQAPADSDKVAWAAWGLQQQADLDQAYRETRDWLAQGAHQVAMDPAGLTDAPSNQHPQTSNDALTPMEWVTPATMWKLYTAHVAFALALEITQPLPWSLTEDSDETLRYLFDSSVMAWRLPNGNFGMGTYGGANLPALRVNTRPQTTFAPPMWTYPWLQQAGLIGTSRLDTIGRVMQWMRGNMVHFYGADTFGTHAAVWQYPGPCASLPHRGGDCGRQQPRVGQPALDRRLPRQRGLSSCGAAGAEHPGAARVGRGARTGLLQLGEAVPGSRR